MTWNYKVLFVYTVHTSSTIAVDKDLIEHCGEAIMNLALEECL